MTDRSYRFFTYGLVIFAICLVATNLIGAIVK